MDFKTGTPTSGWKFNSLTACSGYHQRKHKQIRTTDLCDGNPPGELSIISLFMLCGEWPGWQLYQMFQGMSVTKMSIVADASWLLLIPPINY